MGKYPYSGAEVCPGESPYVPEGAEAVPGELLAGWPAGNRAERSIKPFVIDRKNFLFANTPKGATGSAVIFSMIQTALENQLDPYRYLTWLLQTACGLDMADPAVIQKLLPWQAPDICKAK